MKKFAKALVGLGLVTGSVVGVSGTTSAATNPWTYVRAPQGAPIKTLGTSCLATDYANNVLASTKWGTLMLCNRFTWKGKYAYHWTYARWNTITHDTCGSDGYVIFSGVHSVYAPAYCGKSGTKPRISFNFWQAHFF